MGADQDFHPFLTAQGPARGSAQGFQQSPAALPQSSHSGQGCLRTSLNAVSSPKLKGFVVSLTTSPKPNFFHTCNNQKNDVSYGSRAFLPVVESDTLWDTFCFKSSAKDTFYFHEAVKLNCTDLKYPTMMMDFNKWATKIHILEFSHITKDLHWAFKLGKISNGRYRNWNHPILS